MPWDKRGHGIHEYEQFRLDPNEGGVGKALERIRKEGTFEGWIEPVEHWVERILSRPDASEPNDIEYAQKLRVRIALTREAIGNGEAAIAAAYSLQIGSLVTGYDIAAKWNKSADIGASQSAGLANGRDKSAKSRVAARRPYWNAWQEAANEIWLKKPGLSAPAVAKIIKARLHSDSSSETIRKRIKKPGTL